MAKSRRTALLTYVWAHDGRVAVTELLRTFSKATLDGCQRDGTVDVVWDTVYITPIGVDVVWED